MSSPVIENSPDRANDSVVPEEVTKYSIRKSMWDSLQKNNLVNFPRLCWGRIPNFKGAEDANANLIVLNEFKEANVVKVNPDKPQEAVRKSVLESHKSLLVPIPRLRSGLLNLVVLDKGAANTDIKKAVNRQGIEEYGKPIGLDSKIKIDLVVVGSVAVSKDGYRIGKGEGFADLEFAMMMHMKAVNENTIVITTVHDSQVFDKLPTELFKTHDVPVDIIVTPTQVITVKKRLPKPNGVIWNILSERRLNLMPILQSLREIDLAAGKDVTLKEEDSDVETQRLYKPRYQYKYRMRRRVRSDIKTSESQTEEAGGGEGGRQQRPRKRSNRKPRISRKHSTEENIENGVEGNERDQDETLRNKRNRPKKKFRKNRTAIDFSLRVSNIERNVRVRDLKAALAERGVKPNDITWQGYRGFCFLHFSKPNLPEQGDSAIGVDNIIESLQDLKLTPDSEKSVLVKPAKPIWRIETTDVTSV